MSFVGRLQLIRSVIYNLINFWFSVFSLSKACLDTLERICCAFLWNGAPNSARGEKISWESVCTPTEAGELGLRRLADWNKFFSLKLIWIIFTKGCSLCFSWLKQNLIMGHLFWDLELSTSGIGKSGR